MFYIYILQVFKKQNMTCLSEKVNAWATVDESDLASI